MALPTLTVQIGFGSDPDDPTPTWTDVTSRLQSAQVSRGRNRELDRVRAGTATVTLDNTDGELDPGNTASSYYPNVLPMRRLQIVATWDSTDYVLFTGFITGWPQSYIGPNGTMVDVTAVDAFKVLNLNTVSGTYSEELSGTRIGNVLDDLAWPVADRDLDAGQSTVQASTLDDDNPLTHMQTVTETENGLLYVNGAGQVTFLDRHSLILDTFDAATHTWGTGGWTFSDVGDVNFDDSDVWNYIVARRVGGSEVVGQDATSQSRYLLRRLEKTGLLHTDDDEVSHYVSYLLTRFSEPSRQVNRLDLDLNVDDGQTEHVLGADLWTKVRVAYQPAAGDAVSQDSLIQGIRWSWQAPSIWKVTWQLTPKDRQTDYWVLGTSELGSETRLAY